MKYRIRVNGHGRYIVQRKENWLGPWRSWSGKNFSGDTQRYDTNAEACAGLIEAQAFDEAWLRSYRWTTVITTEKN